MYTSTVKKIAKAIVIGLVSFTFIKMSFAESKYDLFFTDANGKKINQLDALMISSKGSTVYKCQTVEAKPSKTGTSISLRNVKKPKIQ